MVFMLNICTDTLPQSCLSYLAFRVAFQETLERIILAHQVGEDTAACFGYLTEVPFLQAVPPHIQLDLLAETWAKHISEDHFEASLVDESVIYAVCETAARIAEDDPEVFKQYLKHGPLDVELVPDHFMASEIRSVHLNLSSEGDFLLISQFEDMAPEEATKLKQGFKIDADRLEAMFEVLGRWSMSEDFLPNMKQLFSQNEIVQTALSLGVK